MTENKMTNREVLTLIANGTANDTTKVWAMGMITKLDQKNAKRKNTETKAQKENKELMGTILANLSAGTPTVASTLGTILGVSTQKASALCTLLVKEGKVVATDVKVKGKGAVKGYLLPSPITDEEVAE
jgi:predicted HTH transcriptional regulator